MTTKIRPSTLENTAVSTGTYGGQGSSAAQIPVVTVDAQGRLTYAANTTLPNLLTGTSVGSASYTPTFTVAANGAVTSANSVAISIAGEAISSGTVAAARLPYTMNQNIGSSNSPTFAGLTINGAITATGDITAYYSSDARLKDQLITIENALAKVMSLRGVTYNWNMAGQAEGKDINVREAGVIAQDVKEVLPEVVVQRDNGYLAVYYEKLIPLLIEAIKELNQKVESLENK